MMMRTTLSIDDDDVMLAARAIANQRDASTGAVISDLARASLRKPASSATRNGFELLPISNPGAVVTLEIVNELRDDLTVDRRLATSAVPGGNKALHVIGSVKT